MFVRFVLIRVLILTDCHKPLGLADGRINDTQITANSVYQNNYILYGPGRARLNGTGGYRAQPMLNDSSLTVNFEQPMIITGVATQGFFGGNIQEWTKSYYLGYVFGSNTFFFKERNKDVAKVTVPNIILSFVLGIRVSKGINAYELHFTFDELHFIYSFFLFISSFRSYHSFVRLIT